MFLIAVPVLKCILFWSGATDHGGRQVKDRFDIDAMRFSGNGRCRGGSGRELLYELFNLMGLFLPVRSWVVVWAKGLLCRLMLVWRSSCRLVVFLLGVI